jgi:hypothetical protein
LIFLGLLSPITEFVPFLCSPLPVPISHFLEIIIEELCRKFSLIKLIIKLLLGSFTFKEYFALSMIILKPDYKPNVIFDFTHADLTIFDLSSPPYFFLVRDELIKYTAIFFRNLSMQTTR